MTVTIHQPEYIPYIGFFDRISKADIFPTTTTAVNTLPIYSETVEDN